MTSDEIRKVITDCLDGLQQHERQLGEDNSVVAYLQALVAAGVVASVLGRLTYEAVVLENLSQANELLEKFRTQLEQLNAAYDHMSARLQDTALTNLAQLAVKDSN